MKKNASKSVETRKAGWVDDIADKCGYDKKSVESFLKKYNIKASPNTGTPKRVNFTCFSFSGTKKGEFTNDFSFEFDNLGAGIWGLVTDHNGRGKTTALEILKWLFKGKASSNLQTGVKNWIKEATLKFKIDDKSYVTTIQQVEGLITGHILYHKSDTKHSLVSEFNSETEMAEVISDFWLNELGLNQIASFRQSNSELEVGREVEHGWPSLAAALFIGTDYSSLFGDTAMSGLPTRILNMFLGLPWISTHAALKALDGQIKSVANVESAYEDRDRDNRRQRLSEIQAELTVKRNTLSSKNVPEFNNSDYNKLKNEYNTKYSSEKNAYIELVDEEDNYTLVNKEWMNDRKRLTNFLEDKAANVVFKRLNPTCCPHCETKITQAQIDKEKSQHTCAICDSKMIEADESDAILPELEEAERASAATCELLRKSVRTKKLRYSNISQSLTGLQASIEEYEKNLKKFSKDQLEIESLKAEITRLEILEDEYKTETTVPKALLTNTTEKESKIELLVDESKILREAIKITENRFKTLQTELLNDVNNRILDFCMKVGLSQYQAVTLTSNPHLKIEKDGSSTSYSNVSPGEKLRLKVIVTIALISVAEERALGRHPGFLVIDSPAAQEVNQEDLNSLIEGLKQLYDVLPSLQIILASAASPVVIKHIDEEHRLHAKEKNYLW